jgi:hypothetical protein
MVFYLKEQKVLTNFFYNPDIKKGTFLSILKDSGINKKNKKSQQLLLLTSFLLYFKKKFIFHLLGLYRLYYLCFLAFSKAFA